MQAPGGKAIDVRVKSGQTVGALKQMAAEHILGEGAGAGSAATEMAAHMQLRLDGRPLMDPLTLADVNNTATELYLEVLVSQ